MVMPAEYEVYVVLLEERIPLRADVFAYCAVYYAGAKDGFVLINHYVSVGSLEAIESLLEPFRLVVKAFSLRYIGVVHV